MTNFRFTLKVSGIEIFDDYEAVFYNAGCSDALVAVVNGAIELDFDREAASFDEAVGSAQVDVARAGLVAMLYPAARGVNAAGA